MKKVLFVMAVLYTVSSSAQIQKGKWAVNATIMVQDQKTTSTYVGSTNPAIERKTTNTNFGIGFGYFISSSFYAGIKVGYGKDKQVEPYSSTGDPTVTQSVSQMPVGVELKWYKSLGNKFYYNINGAFTYTTVKGNVFLTPADPSFPYNANVTGHSTAVRISPLQVTYALSRRFLVEAGFGYLEYSTGKVEEKAQPGSTGGEGIQKVNTLDLNLSPTTSNFTLTFLF
jgi:hypothetical protein